MYYCISTVLLLKKKKTEKKKKKRKSIDHRCMWTSQVALVVKNLPPNSGDVRDPSSFLGLGRTPARRAWQATPVFLPG